MQDDGGVGIVLAQDASGQFTVIDCIAVKILAQSTTIFCLICLDPSKVTRYTPHFAGTTVSLEYCECSVLIFAEHAHHIPGRCSHGEW